MHRLVAAWEAGAAWLLLGLRRMRFQGAADAPGLVELDEGRITWQPRSTDADYLAQLKEPALRATFSELSFIFKWVWYGDAPMDVERYQRLKPAFEAAHRPAPAAPAQRA